MAFTFFFRDAQTLEMVLDHTLQGFQGHAYLRIWDAGCAHGPEPYTLAMLLRERLSERAFRTVSIHATDIDAGFARTVSEGVYAADEVKRIPDAARDRYFRPADRPGCVQIADELRARVSFQHHDLLALAPLRNDFALIVCKNVLLHFDDAQRCDVVRMFHRALRPGGFLAMEHTQKLPQALGGLFRPVAPYTQVYQRADGNHAR